MKNNASVFPEAQTVEGYGLDSEGKQELMKWKKTSAKCKKKVFFLLLKNKLKILIIIIMKLVNYDK